MVSTGVLDVGDGGRGRNCVMVSKGYSKTSWLVATGTYEIYTTSWYACTHMIGMHVLSYSYMYMRCNK